MKYCPTCGTSLPDEMTYCVKCGAAQPVTKQPVQGQVQPAPTVQQQYYAPGQATVPQAWIQCRKCNAVIPVTPTVPCQQCPVCGASLTVASSAQSHWAAGHIISLVSMIVTFIGQFLPFLKVGAFGISYSFSLWSEKFYISAIVITVLLAWNFLIFMFNENFKGKFAIVTAVITLYIIYENYSTNQARLSSVDTGLEEWGLGTINASGMLHPGVGLYIMFIGCIGMIVGAIALHMRHRN